MKSNFSSAVCVLFLAIFFTGDILAQNISTENSQIRQIKISGSIPAAKLEDSRKARHFDEKN